MPMITPIMFANQSLISALRLKLGCITSINPPKAPAPIKTGGKLKRPVLERGNTRAAKAIMWIILSLPLGAGGGISIGQSIAVMSKAVIIRVRGMSRYLRIAIGY